MAPSSRASKGKRQTVLLFDNEGFSDYTCYLARGLSKHHNIILYSFSEESARVTGVLNDKSIRFSYIKKRLPKGNSAARGLIRIFILFFILFGVLTKTEYDIVHIQNYLPTFFLFIPLLKLRKKQICWSLHDLDLLCLWRNLFAQGINGRLQVMFQKIVTQPTLLTKHIDKILVHAESLRQQLVMKKVMENKIDVVRHFDYQYLLESECNDVNADFESFGLGSGYALFIGNIAPWKGINSLIAAAKIAKEKIGRKFNLVIAGKPYDGFKDVDFFKDLNNGDYKFIKIINKYISTSELPTLLSKSSLIILPYHKLFEYCTSGVIPLAYTFAKPVIVSKIQSLVEYVEHGKTGLVFDTNDYTQLANCIIKLFENSTECKEMGQMAYQKLVNEMSLDKCCRQISNIYDV